MLNVPPLPFLRRRVRKAPPPAPPALTLVSAAYTEGASVTLTFDRPIDIAAIDVAAVTVDDGGASGFMFQGSGAATLASPAAVEVPLVDTGFTASPATTLTAGPGTGIVADDDGGTWAGVTDLPLPFP